jgi:hypothetical protein
MFLMRLSAIAVYTTMPLTDLWPMNRRGRRFTQPLFAVLLTGGYSNSLVRKLSLLHLATMSHERSNDSRSVSAILLRSKP